MKKLVAILCLAFCAAGATGADPAELFNGLTGLQVYAAENARLSSQTTPPRVVFIGNSITQGWAQARPDFFSSNGFVGRGIGGQVSAQMLLRFQSDVVALRPAAVVINCGTNDVAENAGPYSEEFTMECIRSMVQIARANGIVPVLSSVLPAGGFGWRPSVRDAPQKISALNARIEAFAASQSIVYIDYHAAMANPSGALDAGLAQDGVHPTAQGFEVMERLALPIVETALKAPAGDGPPFNLAGRSSVGALPLPDYNSRQQGRVVVEITVNPAGDVTSAAYRATGSVGVDNTMIQDAIRAARRARFNVIESDGLQTGTITYVFRMNRTDR